MVNLCLHQTVSVLTVLVALTGAANIAKRALPEPWESLAGRTEEEIQEFIKRQGPAIVGAKPVPPPLTDTSMKLVNDIDHQWQAPGSGDTRGKPSLSQHGQCLTITQARVRE